MSIIQTFYDKLASQYDKLFLDWETATIEQAKILDRIITKNDLDKTSKILDCACGIGTQTIGLAAIGYDVTGSDISDGVISEARKRAEKKELNINFKNADFRDLSGAFDEQFEIIIAMDNALPHMLSNTDLETAIKSIVNQIKDSGIFIASIRDYDALLTDKPPYSPPYIHKTSDGQRVSFQTWNWNGDNYRLIQYIIDDEEELQVNKFECEYRATRREEMTKLLIESGCKNVVWMFPEETRFYQPIVVAKK